MITIRVALSIALLAFAAGRAISQEHVHAQGEKLGTVHFATSCSPAAQPAFDRAVTLLHSFEFGAAIAGFTQALAADSTCAMAYWGIAMSRWSNPMAAGLRAPAQLRAGLEAANAAVRFSANASEREKQYVGAVSRLYAGYDRVDQATRVASYERAMADVVAKQPADTEAMIFHAIALVAAASPADKSYANQLRAGATLESLWVRQPDHPGLAHYIIHAYDYPALAGRAKAAAERYAVIAPSAAHALHMPSHTFTRVGLWKESVETNRRSRDAALASSSIAEALHASDYTVYADLQMRRDSAARAILEELPTIASRFDPNAITGAAPASAGYFALAAIPARYALERRDWRAAATLSPQATAYPWTEAMTYFARALGAAHTKDLAAAPIAIDSLSAIEQRLQSMGEGYWAEQVAIQRLGAQAWLDHARGRTDAALAAMQEAATREDATEKNAVTPGPLAPAHELLGDMLMELGRPGQALAEYRATLAREPNRYRALDGARRAAEASGDRAAAAGYSAALRRLVG